MYLDENVEKSLEEYRACKSQFHRELMNVYRKYKNVLSIVSIVGIFEIVKQEVIDLEKATKDEMTLEKTN